LACFYYRDLALAQFTQQGSKLVGSCFCIWLRALPRSRPHQAWAGAASAANRSLPARRHDRHFARIAAQKLSEHFGKKFYFENIAARPATLVPPRRHVQRMTVTPFFSRSAPTS
jgi:hypothetical protein